MRVIDDKNIDYTYITKKYEQLNKDLLVCSSFKRQKECLVLHYKDSVLSRDELIIRKLSLERRKTFNFTSLLSYEKEILISVVICLLGVFLSEVFKYIFDNGNLKDVIDYVKPLIIPYIITFLIIFVVYFFCIQRDFKDYHRNEVPLYEIYLCEVSLIEFILASDNQEITEDELWQVLKNNNYKK